MVSRNKQEMTIEINGLPGEVTGTWGVRGTRPASGLGVCVQLLRGGLLEHRAREGGGLQRETQEGREGGAALGQRMGRM